MPAHAKDPEERRDQHLQVCLTLREMRYLEKYSKARHRLNNSGAARELLLDRLIEKGFAPAPQVSQEESAA